MIKKLLHDILGWGYPNGVSETDPFQQTYNCLFCNGELAQDSTGAWFHLTKNAYDKRDEKEN